MAERLNADNERSNWKWPDIEGVHDFRGDLIHTASWPEAIDLKDKVVAVIGNGASGIQVLPAIRPRKFALFQLLDDSNTCPSR